MVLSETEKLESVQRNPLKLPRRSPADRLAFLDLFRGIAVFGMFDAHITNALVSTPEAASRLYYYHDLLFNLPAPGFLFAAGISYGMSVAGRWNDYRVWSPALRSRLMRLFEILVLGYLLHVPYFSLRKNLYVASQAQIVNFLNMDVLQCIAAGAFALLVLTGVLPSARWFFRTSVALTVFVPLASPVVWNLSPRLPWWLGTFVSKHWGSNFPLFPYSGFLFAGAAWGYLYAAARRNDVATNFMRASGKAGGGLFLAGTVAAGLSLPAPYNDFWNASPQFFLLRIGFFAVVMALLFLVESRLLPGLRFLVLLGKESLVVYISHLTIIYGSLVNPRLNLRMMIGSGANFWQWLAVYVLLTITMTLLARLL